MQQIVRLNLTGHENVQLEDAGYAMVPGLHLTKEAFKDDMSERRTLQLISELLVKHGVRSGSRVEAVLPVYARLRDLLMVAIQATSGNFPSVVYPGGDNFATGQPYFTVNKPVDYGRIRSNFRAARPDTITL